VQLPASQEVEMDMEHCLACICVGVHDQAEAMFSDAFFFGDLCCQSE
jgi:hypothetical protein